MSPPSREFSTATVTRYVLLKKFCFEHTHH